MRYAIYLMIGMGLNAAIEMEKRDLTFGESFVVVAMWPAVVAGVAATFVMKEKSA